MGLGLEKITGLRNRKKIEEHRNGPKETMEHKEHEHSTLEPRKKGTENGNKKLMGEALPNLMNTENINKRGHGLKGNLL